MDPAPDPAELTELVLLATDVANAAAAQLVEGLALGRSIETKTSSTDMVTDMDHASERTIVEGILARRPHDGVVGEEGSDRAGSSGVRWIIDPIDGTTNYVYGHPGFAVSIAAERTGPRLGRSEVVVGVVADPLHGEVFTATAGGGAFRNGRPIRCSTATELDQALVATGFSYDADRRRRQAKVLTQLLPSIRDIRRMGAASVDLCSVACGRVDAYYERGLKPWDFAAGALIASEAGALVSDLDGRAPSESFTLAAGPGVHEALAARLTAAGAAEA